MAYVPRKVSSFFKIIITLLMCSGVLAEGQGAAAPPPLRVKNEGCQNGNLKHMGAEGALVDVLVK